MIFNTGANTPVTSVNGQTGDVMIPFGICDTAADVTAKTVTVSPAVTQTDGQLILVRFANGITSASTTLNVNDIGAYDLAVADGTYVTECNAGQNLLLHLKYNSSSSRWGWRVVSALDPTKIKKTEILSSSVNLNTVLDSGFYRLGATPQNAPSGVDYGQLIVSRGSDSMLQIVAAIGGDCYWRTGYNIGKTGQTFTSWQKVASSNTVGTVVTNEVVSQSFNAGGNTKYSGCSITLDAGTWVITAQANIGAMVSGIRQGITIAFHNTDNSFSSDAYTLELQNATQTVNQYYNITYVVNPVSSTTYYGMVFNGNVSTTMRFVLRAVRIK